MAARGSDSGGRACKAGGPTDHAVLTPPLVTTLTGMRQALHALEAGNPETVQVLLDEANLVYECRVCLNMFRSLANLLAHKRHYCRRRYAAVRHEFSGQGDPTGVDINKKSAVTTVVIEPEPVTDCCLSDPNSWGGDLTTYSPSMELIKTAGILQEMSQVPDRRKTLNTTLARLNGGRSRIISPAVAAKVGNLTVRLEPVYQTDNVFYQSWYLTDDATGERLYSVGEINMALQRFIIADDHTVVGPDGRAVPQLTNIAPRTESGIEDSVIDRSANRDQEQEKLRKNCNFCKSSFKTWFHLKRHLVTKHKMDPDDVQRRKAEILALAKPVTCSEAANNSVQGSVIANSVGSVCNGVANKERLKPVKLLKVDVKKVRLPPDSICQIVGPLGGGGVICPLLAQRTAATVATGEAAAAVVVSTAAETEAAAMDEQIPQEVVKKIMESVNRRKLQCTLCQRRFSRTYLVQQHVASAHLGLERWRCTVCHFGAWKRKHVLRHMVDTHRQRNIEGSLREEPMEVYFSAFMPPSQSTTAAKNSLPALKTVGTNGGHWGIFAKTADEDTSLDFNGIDSGEQSDICSSSDKSEENGSGISISSWQRESHNDVAYQAVAEKPNGEPPSDSLMVTGTKKSQFRGQCDSDEEVSLNISPKLKRLRGTASLKKAAANPVSETAVEGAASGLEPRTSSGGRKRAASESPNATISNTDHMPRRKIAHV